MPCVLAKLDSLSIGIPNHLFGNLCWVYGICHNSVFALFYVLELCHVHLVSSLLCKLFDTLKCGVSRYMLPQSQHIPVIKLEWSITCSNIYANINSKFHHWTFA